MWHLCTEMSKEDHLIITKKIEYTLCGHSVIMNKRRDCTLRSSLNVQPLFFRSALPVLRGYIMPIHSLGPCMEHCFPYRKIHEVRSHP